ncbi:hypothetical protein [Bosea sp. (in: a-proteobacteria)]|jgi:hypothetical protein|uniref:hypothetical protein n=1 Tax=Bosea sp. (in: a-proteobacteria) TaxID=1871050 RepID=UPI003F6F47D8
MSDARSLTPLSEGDYEAIAAAVMETARGRWFMAEHAKRNRQADTTKVLAAITKLQRAIGQPASQPASGPDLREAIALIADLRTDLERISGKASEPSSHLAARIENAAGGILSATESIQEAAWSLRESGAGDELCDLLDRRSTEIYAATAVVEGTAHQISKIADTIAMLDSSLRAFTGTARETAGAPAPRASSKAFNLPEAAPLSNYDDIEIVEIDDKPHSTLDTSSRVRGRPSSQRRLGTVQIIEEDLVFAEAGESSSKPSVQSHPAPPATSEVELRAIDALPASEKLAYFA